MPARDRKLWNSAERIVMALQQGRCDVESPRLPLQHQSDLLRLQRQHEIAQQRGWHAAAQQVRQTLHSRSQWFVNDLQRFVNDSRPEPDEPLVTAGDLYRDVLALMSEFPDVHVDRPETTVSVVTDRIVLEAIDLGPFEIVWNWSRLHADQELRIVPQEPNYARRDDEVCHPHIRGTTLCVGDAEIPLRRAFHAGRLYDAFLILRQVLQTYNPSSPYVALSDWSGSHCAWCDQPLSDSDAWGCETCGETLCEDCHRACHVCGNTLCERCETLCADCDAAVCRACRPLLGHRRSERCPTCHTKEQTADEEDHDEELPTPPDTEVPDPEVLPHGVGQAPLLAGCG